MRSRCHRAPSRNGFRGGSRPYPEGRRVPAASWCFAWTSSSGVASGHTDPGEGVMSTPDENAAIARELIQKVLNEGDIGFAEKTLSEDYVERTPMPGGTNDKAGAIAMFQSMRSMTPDMHIEVHETIASGDKVVVHSTM